MKSDSTSNESFSVLTSNLSSSCKALLKDALILFCLYCFGLLPLIIADAPYIDDNCRTPLGYAGWSDSSRYLSDFLAPIVHGSSLLPDIAPLSQIIAVFEMALCGAIILRAFYPRSKRTAFQYIALVPLCVSPYFLQCLSFRYDSTYIALSVLFCVLPLLWHKGRPACFFLTCFAGALGTCLTYQASLGILPMCICALCFLDWLDRAADGKTIALRIASSAVGYGLAILSYRVFLVKKVAGYVDASVPPITEMPHTVLANFATYCKTLLGGFHTLWFAISLICILVLVYGSCRLHRKPGSAPIRAAAAMIVVALMFLVSFGIYPLMTLPSFVPRSLYGFTVFVSLVALMAVSMPAFSIPVLLSKACEVVLACELVVFAFAYGNALTEQENWTDFRTDEAVEQLASVPAIASGEEPVRIQVQGTIGWAPSVQRLCNDDNSSLMRSLIIPTFNGPGWAGRQRLFNYYNLPLEAETSGSDDWGRDFPLVSESYYSAVYAKGNEVLLLLK